MAVRRTPFRSLALRGVTLGVALVVSACNPHDPLSAVGDDAGGDPVVVVQAPSDEPHSVYYLQHQRMFVHLDPQRDDDADTQAFARTFLQRSLAGLRYAAPGNVARRRPGPRPRPRPARPAMHDVDLHPPPGGALRGRVTGHRGSGQVRGLAAVRPRAAVPRARAGSLPPRRAQGLSGSLRGDRGAAAAFERAVEVSSDGMTVTFHLVGRRPTSTGSQRCPRSGPFRQRRTPGSDMALTRSRQAPTGSAPRTATPWCWCTTSRGTPRVTGCVERWWPASSWCSATTSRRPGHERHREDSVARRAGDRGCVEVAGSRNSPAGKRDSP